VYPERDYLTSKSSPVNMPETAVNTYAPRCFPGVLPASELSFSLKLQTAAAASDPSFNGAVDG